ncbi:restriction endonuclease [soil metagenome]
MIADESDRWATPGSGSSDIPQYHQLFNAVMAALKELGGSGSIQEVNAKTIDSLSLSPNALGRLHNPDQGNETEVEYRLAWARTYLKKYGLIDNSSRGVWALTRKSEELDEVNPSEVVRFVREQSRKKADNSDVECDIETVDEEVHSHHTWRTRLHQLLTKEIGPDAFERLVQRLLRESGFTQVEVTGRSGDGGIDGKGIAKIHGLMSFHVIFQCKRYQGVVSSGEIRDFRGAMVGRADKGLFITTGTYSREAIKEATRDGAPPIDLLDGDQLTDKLKEMGLGIKVEMVEKVTVDSDWFQTI